MSFKFLASTLALALASPAAADVLIDNVEGLTIGEDGKVKRFTALVIDDAGWPGPPDLGSAHKLDDKERDTLRDWLGGRLPRQD